MAHKLETVIEKYIEVREKRALLKRAYEAEDFVLKQAAEKIEAHLLAKLNADNLDSFKTSAGTAYIAVEMKASCASWPDFWNWLAENKRFDMLEKRVALGGIRAYQEENENELPPFINTMTERVVRVRRS